MGIVADIHRSMVKFGDPLIPRDALNSINRQVAFDMHSFTITFGIYFNPEPKIGIGGLPQNEQLWTVGIVQNVLFQYLYIEYESRKVFTKTWKDPVLDYVDGSRSKPFYGDPPLVPTNLTRRPVAEIIYTSKGYRESAARGGTFDNKPDTLDMWDEPAGGSALRFQGSMIRRIEKVISFQAWLVATTKEPLLAGFHPIVRDLHPLRNINIIVDRPEVLAHVPVFTLVFWLDTKPKKAYKDSFDVPEYNYGMFVEEGFVDPKRINRAKSGIQSSPIIKPILGNGGRMPVLVGASGNERANAFLTENGLQ
jgi:hypothetical protein